jgi:hypothetical protein
MRRPFGPSRRSRVGTIPSADSSCAVGGIPTPPSQFPWHATSQDSHEPSRGKSSSRRCIDAGFIKHAPLWMEDLVVACPLVPGVPHLLSGSCSSPRTCAPRFLQPPPHGDALALRLSFGSTSAWTGDFHPRAVRHARHTRRQPPAAAQMSPFTFIQNRKRAAIRCNGLLGSFFISSRHLCCRLAPYSTSSTVEPIVFPDSIAACALATSRSG